MVTVVNNTITLVRGRYRMSKSLFKCWYSGIALFIGEPVDVDGVEPVEVYNHVVMP